MASHACATTSPAHAVRGVVADERREGAVGLGEGVGRVGARGVGVVGGVRGWVGGRVRVKPGLETLVIKNAIKTQSSTYFNPLYL